MADLYAGLGAILIFSYIARFFYFFIVPVSIWMLLNYYFFDKHPELKGLKYGLFILCVVVSAILATPETGDRLENNLLRFREKAAFDRAMESQEPEDCRKISTNTETDGLRISFGACVTKIAIMKKDIGLCDMLSNPYDKDMCVHDYAIAIDRTLCSVIMDASVRQHCDEGAENLIS